MKMSDLKILAIDDNRDNLTTLKAVVEDRLPGARMISAMDGPGGLAMALTEDPDVILLDIVMPGMDGYEVCRELKADKRLRTIPVLFLTALRTDRESRLEALEAGAEGFLSKPFDEIELSTQIRAMAKIKIANHLQRRKQERLETLVAERTRELEQELSERLRVEEEREITIQLLRLTNTCTSTRQLAQEAVTFFRKISGFEAVGLRFSQGEDYPYYQTEGLPDNFVQLEMHLCVRDQAGRIRRDGSGHPLLECMCGNVICGRTDPSQPFFTAQGSFWTNSTTQLLASSSESDRQSRTRNRCHGEGYESVALFPLRVANERLGLMQMNDRRPGQFTPEKVALWERLAASLAVSLSKLHSDEALRESEERHRNILQTAMDGFWLLDMEGRILDVNTAYCLMSGYNEQELLTMRVADLEASESTADTVDHISMISTKGEERFESQHRRKNGGIFDVEVSAKYWSTEGGRLVVFLQDITNSKQASLRIKSQLVELQRWQDVMLGREDRIQELKSEVNELSTLLGKSTPYSSTKARKVEI